MRVKVTYMFENGKSNNNRSIDVELKKGVYQLEYLEFLLAKLTKLEVKSLYRIDNYQYGKSNIIKWLMQESEYDFKTSEFWAKFKDLYIKGQKLDRPFLNIIYCPSGDSKTLSLKVDVTHVIGEGMLSDLIQTGIDLLQKDTNLKIVKVIYFKMSKEFPVNWLKKDYTQKNIRI